MKLFGQLLIMCFCISNLQAQRVCGTPQYESSRMIIGGRIEQQTNSFSRDTVPNEIITIPVVVHLLFNNASQNISDAQVLSQIKALNEDFRRLNVDASNTPSAFLPFAADSRIMFCLAQVDPTGRATRGIVRKHTNVSSFMGDDGMKFSGSGGDDAWDSKKYLNIWVCSLFGRSLGYATPPGGPADKDGVVINFDVFGTTGSLRANFDKGRTATHEVGHWLGLRHIWGDETCGNDEVDDTPRQLSYNFNCPSFPHVTSCSPNGYGDMFMNFMDLTNDACMNLFTNGQKTRMRSLFALSGSKNSFLNSYACDSSLASGAPLPDDTIPTVKAVGEIKAFPNPAQNSVTITGIDEYNLEGKDLTIFNMSGIKVFQTKLKFQIATIDLTRIPAGVYIIKVGDGKERKTLKLIKI